MLLEKRDNQNLTRNHSSPTIRCNGQTEYLWHKSGQLDWCPDRWLRIGFAAQKKETVFNNLLTHINVETLREAFNVIDGSKALGTDRISKIEYGKNLEANLGDLMQRIHKGSYKPQPKREVLIPKANGKTRPIAISCFEDKIVERVIGKILETIYEQNFIRNSFGFRPGKSAHQAIEAIYYSLKDNRRPYVVEIDFANFFNSIPHGKLLETLGKRILDRRFKALIERFLKVGILEQSGSLTYSEEGTPQGSIMSPILANVYLHEVLDTWFIQNYASYYNIIARYADDAVFFFKKKEVADKFVQELNERVQSFGLILNETKTNQIYFARKENSSFNFLSFTFYWGRNRACHTIILKLKTQKQVLEKKIKEFYHWIKEVRSKLRLNKIWNLAKAKLRGHYQYFGYAMNRTKLNHFYQMAIRSMFKWLNRRSQKRSFDWVQFNRKFAHNLIPSPPVIANLIHLRRVSCLN